MISVTNQTSKFAPVWTIILKIRAIFVHQTLTEHALLIIHYSLSPGFWQSFISIEVSETVYRHLHHPAKNN